MKKRWTIFALILIAVGVYAYTSFQQNNKEEAAIEKVLNKVDQVNEIAITKDQKTVKLTGNQATQFIETRPLVKIEKYERKYGSYFEKEPKYTIEYLINGKQLYAVELYQVKKSIKSLEIEPFLINEHLLVKWQGNNLLLSQHEKISKLLEHLNAKK